MRPTDRPIERTNEHPARLAAPPPRGGGAARWERPGATARYVATFLLVALALVLTLAGQRLIAPQYSLLFFAAVLASAWYGGLGPGLVATALALAALDYFFIPPLRVFGGFSVRDAVGLAVFAGVAAVTSSLSQSLRAQREHAEARTREVERLSAELEARAALRLEEKVREAEALAAELARTNRALERKSAEAEAATRAKSDFLAAVSHELRTPLTAIGGYAELMAAGLRGPLTDEQRHDLARIQVGQQHLLALINDLLDSAKAAAGQLSLDVGEVHLADVVARAHALVDPLVAGKGLRLEWTPLDGLPTVRADADRLVQVLVNLVSNAVKFTDPGGEVRVKVDDSGPRRVALAVSDTGRGIPAAERERIFEPFAQVHATDGAAQRGTGLGLAISRDLVRAMGGDLTLESAIGAGSTFTVWLPRADDAGSMVLAGAGAGAGVLTLWPPVAFVPPG